jgi:LacI family transcriptional regulator
MARERAPARDLLIDPVGVVRRRSTDVLVVENPGVGRAVQYVREHLDESFGVEALLREARVSRRSLEQGFKRALGCTPHAFLCRARVDRAKDLLAKPKRMKLTEIAAACGFTDLRRFRLVFARCEGMTPAEYRRRQQASAAEQAGPAAPVAAGAPSTQPGPSAA